MYHCPRCKDYIVYQDDECTECGQYIEWEKRWTEKIAKNLFEYMSKAVDKIEEFSDSIFDVSKMRNCTPEEEKIFEDYYKTKFVKKVKEEPVVEDTFDIEDKKMDSFEALEGLYQDAIENSYNYARDGKEQEVLNLLIEDSRDEILIDLLELNDRKEFDKPVQFAMDIHTGPYCPECGSKVRWYSNGYQQKFCSQCGKPIGNDRGYKV